MNKTNKGRETRNKLTGRRERDKGGKKGKNLVKEQV